MERKVCGIYGIRNKLDGKWYVGQSVDIRLRWNFHKSMLSRNDERESTHLLRAWNKYGEDAFEWMVLEECGPDDLNEREIFWIAEKDSFKNGYNRTIGGGGIHGYTFSDEHIEKIREATKSKWADEEHRAMRLDAMHKVMGTDEYRKKLSDAAKRNFADPEFKAEALRKMREGADNPETHRKRSESAKRVNARPDVKEKISAASKRMWQDEAHNQMMVEARKKLATPEYKEFFSRTSKERWQDDEYRKKVIERSSEGKRNSAPEVLQVETEIVFRSALDAAESLGKKSGSGISACCLGERKTAHGYHWRYANETQGEWDARRNSYTESHGISEIRKVFCIETETVFDTQEDAACSVGINSSGINKVCSGEQLTAGGYSWRYLDETEEERTKREKRKERSDRVVRSQHSMKKVMCVETGCVYNSLQIASKELGINRVGITNACAGRAKTAGGYHWKIVG